MSAPDEPMALSTQMVIAAAIAGTIAYLHGLLGAVLAERHVQHIAGWAGGVSTLLGFCTVALVTYAAIIRIAEQSVAQSQLDAENRLKWERANQAHLVVESRKLIDAGSSVLTTSFYAVEGDAGG
ncbi:MAG: hypothetical protein JWN04_4619 [Myxococcaceae bacterium]|nr:hypothetical protein [Myxococcaceae bacterium]